jgi:hypothetical protein
MSIHEHANDIRSVANQILRGGGSVVDVARVHNRAVIQQVLGDSERRGAVESRFAVTSARGHSRRVAIDEFADTIEHAEMGRGNDFPCRAARDERRGLFGRDVVLEQSEGAHRPVALQSQIGAVLEQDVEQRQVLPRHRRRP